MFWNQHIIELSERLLEILTNPTLILVDELWLEIRVSCQMKWFGRGLHGPCTWLLGAWFLAMSGCSKQDPEICDIEGKCYLSISELQVYSQSFLDWDHSLLHRLLKFQLWLAIRLIVHRQWHCLTNLCFDWKIWEINKLKKVAKWKWKLFFLLHFHEIWNTWFCWNLREYFDSLENDNMAIFSWVFLQKLE